MALESQELAFAFAFAPLWQVQTTKQVSK